MHLARAQCEYPHKCELWCAARALAAADEHDRAQLRSFTTASFGARHECWPKPTSMTARNAKACTMASFRRAARGLAGAADSTRAQRQVFHDCQLWCAARTLAEAADYTRAQLPSLQIARQAMDGAPGSAARRDSQELCRRSGTH